MSTNWKVGGSIPASPRQHAEVSVGKTRKPKLPLMACINVTEKVCYIAALYECVCDTGPPTNLMYVVETNVYRFLK